VLGRPIFVFRTDFPRPIEFSTADSSGEKPILLGLLVSENKEMGHYFSFRANPKEWVISADDSSDDDADQMDDSPAANDDEEEDHEPEDVLPKRKKGTKEVKQETKKRKRATAGKGKQERAKVEKE
jgi:hypothetical protein